MNESGFFEYEITYWDEVDSETAFRQGVTWGKNLVEATCNICKFYGSDNIEDIKLFPLYPSSVYEFNEEENHFDFSEIHSS